MKRLEVLAAIALLTSMLLFTFPLSMKANADYPLNSMYIVPSEINFNQYNATVGTLFNVTVWAYMENGTFTWQVNMTFNPNLVQAVTAGYTGSSGSKSEFFADQTATVPVAPIIDNATGYVLFAETLLGNEYEGQNNASLFWAEFVVVSAPNATVTSLTGAFSINNADTYFLDSNLNTISTTAYNASYSFTYPVTQISYPLDSFWVSPSSIDFNQGNAGVGTLFNVTVWAYMENGTFAWEVNMTFNPALVGAVSAGFTGSPGSRSEFFAGQPTTIPITPLINNSSGYVLVGESLLGNEYEAENNASLCWVEFEVVSVPNATTTSLTGAFDINNAATLFLDFNVNVIPTTKYDATYSFAYMSVQGAYPLDSFWVSPSSIDFNQGNAGVGTLFNVTVWAYMENNTFVWEVKMTFNPSLVQAVTGGVTGLGGVKSQFFADQAATVVTGPLIDNTTGSVEMGETLLGDEYEGQNNASLCWVEFEVVSVPNATVASLTGTFNILHPDVTFFLDTNLDTIPVTYYDAAYSSTYVPGFTSPWAVSVSPSSVAVDVGQSTPFASAVTGGTGPYSYKWYLNGSLVSGATSPTWAFTSSSAGSCAVYVNVTDSLGMQAISNTATVTVYPVLNVSIAPTFDTIPAGESLLFTSNVSGGASPYTYQWYLNSTAVSGAIGPAWTFTPSGAGSYVVYLNVTDLVNAATTSSKASVTLSVISEFPAVTPLILVLFITSALILTLTRRRKTPAFTVAISRSASKA